MAAMHRRWLYAAAALTALYWPVVRVLGHPLYTRFWLPMAVVLLIAAVTLAVAAGAAGSYADLAAIAGGTLSLAAFAMQQIFLDLTVSGIIVFSPGYVAGRPRGPRLADLRPDTFDRVVSSIDGWMGLLTPCLAMASLVLALIHWQRGDSSA